MELQNNQAQVAQEIGVIKAAVNKAPKRDKLGRSYGTGRRKVAIARVWIKPGTGKITINKVDIKSYLKRETLFIHATEPLIATNNLDKFDVFCTTSGGGISGQAGAVRHGIARALDEYDPVLYHVAMRSGGFLTRDDRMVESKKYGRHKARRSTQFIKR
jgi:small subunit ribosomal protein S9